MSIEFFKKVFGHGAPWKEVTVQEFSGSKAAPASGKDSEIQQENTMATREPNSGDREAEARKRWAEAELKTKEAAKKSKKPAAKKKAEKSS